MLIRAAKNNSMHALRHPPCRRPSLTLPAAPPSRTGAAVTGRHYAQKGGAHARAPHPQGMLPVFLFALSLATGGLWLGTASTCATRLPRYLGRYATHLRISLGLEAVSVLCGVVAVVVVVHGSLSIDSASPTTWTLGRYLPAASTLVHTTATHPNFDQKEGCDLTHGYLCILFSTDCCGVFQCRRPPKSQTT